MTYISATGGVSDGSKGDITVSGNTWTVVDDSHSHTEATISVSGFAASIHTHAQSDIINLPTTLAGYAATIHTHAQSDIADLPTTLSGYSTTTHTHTGVYEPVKGSDDNYVTDAQLVVIGNTSGTNTGDNATNSQYSGLAASKQDTLVSGTNIKTINGTTILGSGDLEVSGGVTDGDKGDITISSSGATYTLDAVVNSTKMTATGWGETKYYRGDDTWQTIAGGGDVVGPSSSVDNGFARFDGTSGKTIQNGAGPTLSDDGTINLIPGSTSYAPVAFASGVVTSTATAGSMEYDGKVHYSSHASSSRGVNIAHQFIDTVNAYTIPTEGPGLRAMFGSPANGAITLQSSTMYCFECIGSLTSMSTTSGTFSFGFLGTAGVSSIRYIAVATKGSATSPVTALVINSTQSSASILVGGNANTTGQFTIKGQLHVDTGGTLLPAIANSQVARPIVGVGSYFAIWPVGADTVVSVGNWS